MKNSFYTSEKFFSDQIEFLKKISKFFTITPPSWKHSKPFLETFFYMLSINVAWKKNYNVFFKSPPKKEKKEKTTLDSKVVICESAFVREMKNNFLT